jgi:hypothetical protein
VQTLFLNTVLILLLGKACEEGWGHLDYISEIEKE